MTNLGSHRSNGVDGSHRDGFGDQEVNALSDAALVIASAHGSEDALAEIYSRYGSSVYGVARSLCVEKVAEDVTHEVFLALWKSPDSFDPDRGSLRSHLLAVAHRHAVNQMRSAPCERDVDAVEPLSYHDRGSKALTAYAHDGACVLLDDLSDPQRHAIILAYFAGHTYREVAERLHRSGERVRDDVSDAMRILRATVFAD
jgi:RNA polymerase sigma-70 factor (ECF subfamily)